MAKPKKCKHDKCKRPADTVDNKRGFCNKCIQLNTAQCNYCSDSDMNPHKHREQIIKCPKCKVDMEKMSNGRFVIDKCTKCKGVFLDGNEINMVKHISFFHYVRDYFRRGKHA